MTSRMDSEVDPALVANATANRMALQFFQKYERFEVQEMLSQTSFHWFLSQEEHRLLVDPPLGLIKTMKPLPTEKSDRVVLMFEADPTIEDIDFREIHQVIRELVMGIYGLSQVPSITLEANFDRATTCHLPPAYNDSRIGQLLVNTDYMMKGLWHGAYFPKEKRLKFSEKWRGSLNLNALGMPETKKILLTEFTLAGMIDVTKDADYSSIYDNMRMFPMSKQDANQDKRLFMRYVDDMGLIQTWRQKSAKQHNNLFLVDATWEVAGILRLHEDLVDRDTFERLQTRLQAHVDVIQRNLHNKAETRKELEMLKIISFLIPFFMAMKRRNKIPDIEKLLPPLAADDCKTERELPPLILSKDFRCPNFDFGDNYFHLHGGIQFDIETDDVMPLPEEIREKYAEMEREASTHLNRVTDKRMPYMESYPLPIKEINGKKYHFFAVDFETYYRISPPQPLWVHAFYDKIKDLKPKRLPLQDNHMHEQFKKIYGYKQAIKYKNHHAGLKQSAIRGMVSVFHTLARKSAPSQLGKQDESGYSLGHYSAKFNRPEILQLLVGQGQDLNQRRFHLTSSVGTTALHLAAKCGSLAAALCIVSNKSDMILCDKSGWSAIHHAAFYNHTPILRMIIRRGDDLLEFQTLDGNGQTPLLIAASSGALESVKLLIELGADICKLDQEKNNIIQLAAMRFHTNVLEHFIEWKNPDVPVWKTLVDMLQSKHFRMRDSAVRSLEILTTSSMQHSLSILEAGGVPALVKIMGMKNTETQSLGAAVLCNMTQSNEKVCQELATCGAIPVLIRLLGSELDDIQSRVAVVISDLAACDENQSLFSSHGGIEPLINLLDSELEDVLVNTVNAIRVVCLKHHDNQTRVASAGAIEPLTEFLQVNSDILQAASAAALAAITYKHKENQDKVVSMGAVNPLVNLLKLRNMEVQVKAAAALESLAESNPNSQLAILDLNAHILLIRLLKIWALDVKEQAACTLWALAGHTRPQQKMIAETIGISGIIDLIVKSERLKYVGCKATIALTRQSFDNQNKIKEENGISPLVRILRSTKTSERVLLTVIQALGTLCLGVANRNNKVTQKKIAEEGAITTLVQLLYGTSVNNKCKVEIVMALGCIILGNKPNQDLLLDEPLFSIQLILDLLYSEDEDVCLRAGSALATFAFNNTTQQYAIREAGGIRMSAFQRFLDSNSEAHMAHAAFQIVVLARVIVDQDQVSLSAEGVTKLVSLLKSEDDETIILSASLVACLAHTRAGIPDAIITSGAVEILIEHLFSPNMEVRAATAVALGYLTFNRTATRLLLIASRNTPGLYDKLMDNLDKDAKISNDFTDEFKRQESVGLPALSLEKHGGPPAVPPPRERGKSAKSRPHTSMSMLTQKKDENRKVVPRSTSAPVHRKDRAPKSVLKVKSNFERRSTVISGAGDAADSSDTKAKNGMRVAWD